MCERHPCPGPRPAADPEAVAAAVAVLLREEAKKGSPLRDGDRITVLIVGPCADLRAVIERADAEGRPMLGGASFHAVAGTPAVIVTEAPAD